MRLFIFRHGETSMCDTPKSCEMNRDVSLTINGISQVYESCKLLCQMEQIDCIFSSNTKRTKETSEIIKSYFDCPLIVDERLCNKGDYMQNTLNFLHHVIEKKYETVCIVTHGRILKLFHHFLMNNFCLPENEAFKMHYCEYGSFNEYNII